MVVITVSSLSPFYHQQRDYQPLACHSIFTTTTRRKRDQPSWKHSNLTVPYRILPSQQRQFDTSRSKGAIRTASSTSTSTLRPAAPTKDWIHSSIFCYPVVLVVSPVIEHLDHCYRRRRLPASSWTWALVFSLPRQNLDALLIV